VIGNPPFIRYQTFPEEHRLEAFKLMTLEGLNPSRLTNAWVPFVVAATAALKTGGRLALVVPAEILQVGYAAQLRGYLARKFTRVNLVSFRELLFEGIQQETILLLAERGDTDAAEIAVLSANDAHELVELSVDDHPLTRLNLDHAEEKWTRYFLSDRELGVVREIEQLDAFSPLGDFASIDVGLVTGQNDFFALSPAQADAWGLRKYCLPLISRSAHIPGLTLGQEAWKELGDAGERTLLLQLGDVARESLSPDALSYVEVGEQAGYHQGYKCRIRQPKWWHVPSVWVPDAFMLRQIHLAPRIVVNAAAATCTDTLHRVAVRPDVTAVELAVASLNSVTLAFAEIKGRSYGGGVLELEPREAEAIPLPRDRSRLPSLEYVDKLLQSEGLMSAIEVVDRAVLIPAGLNRTDVDTIRTVWQNLRDRRLHRRRRVKRP
jgi:adenine-specific DNA methylase